MPTYVYTDGEHEQEVFHGMTEDLSVSCGVCRKPMHRKPQAPRINWNGLPPSKGELSPQIREMIATKGERRAKFEEEHEKHERRKTKSTD